MDSNTLEGASRAIGTVLPRYKLDSSQRTITKHSPAVEPRRSRSAHHHLLSKRPASG